MTTHTTGHFTFADWQETEAGQAADGARIARAQVTNGWTGAITAPDTVCQYSIVYTTDKTGSFTGHELVDGELDGRRGGFVLAQRGSFGEDGTVHCSFEVVPGSGSGELVTLTGRGSFTAPQGVKEVGYTLDYALAD
ncbi:DUF3224 domain-containing protein [Streptomyces coffeae]|uniref:DUF3224 domain-containing protein n=1 Tax=Streptomyces coffeae TaxID=621382 RepID=A0ABS1NKR8_9ACTN|nr:DUF3224 domain-containing protein [Streptomyces coffeae]MBL1100699.1 DUF3224 domain-containing protein [Streptomyces coffeae]